MPYVWETPRQYLATEQVVAKTYNIPREVPIVKPKPEPVEYELLRPEGIKQGFKQVYISGCKPISIHVTTTEGYIVYNSYTLSDKHYPISTRLKAVMQKQNMNTS